MKSFLGQVYIAIGLYDEAQKLLHKAIALHDDEEPSAVRGQNRAILGKIYLEWGRVVDAEKLLLEGWKETQDAGMVATVPVVRRADHLRTRVSSNDGYERRLSVLLFFFLFLR